MKAVKSTKYGAPEVLKIVEIDKPEPKDNEVLVKNYATTVTVADSRVRGFIVPLSYWIIARIALGLFKPRQKILGGELSGVIERVGKNVTKFKVGDKIFAFLDHKLGAYSEYVCIKEDERILKKPENLNFKESAALSFGGTTALHFLKKAEIKPGEKILIYGASGSVGTYAVQLAKYFGTEVTGVCSSKNLELVKSIGAVRVVDYTNNDFEKLNEKFDVVFDTVGKANISKMISILKPKGRYIHCVTTPYTKLKIQLSLLKTNIKLIGDSFSSTVEQINFINELAKEGFLKPVIDKEFNFNEIVQAHHYVDQGHKIGNVVISIID